MAKVFFAIAIMVVILSVGVWYLRENSRPETAEQTDNQQTTPEVRNGTADTPTPEKPSGKLETAEIRYTDSGFVPNSLTVKKGTSVTFKNESTHNARPASALHPTHQVYPGSDIAKCGGPEASLIFDACREIRPGDSWTFRFYQIGKWNYHDHLNVQHFGSITVEDAN